MDLNYLLHRQQVERSRAKAAASEKARKAHEELARQYEEQIEKLTGAAFSFPNDEPSSQTTKGAGLMLRNPSSDSLS